MVGILAANSAVADDYQVTNSLRLNDDDTPRFDKTLGTPTNTDKFTASFWFKKCKMAAAQTVFGYDSGGTAQSYITFTSDDKLEYYNRLGSGNASQFTTNKLFRDPSAWYHIVVAVDSTDGTAGDRCKIYVNGERQTSFATSSFADQNQNQNLNSALAIRLFAWSSGEQVDGYISELYFIDGAAKAPTDFGKTNDNGVWIPKEYTGTYGDNGYRFEFKQTGTSTNASGIGADTSGNGTHFAVTNLAATDVTTDTPSNNFATMNSIESPRQQGGVITFSEGNCKIVTSYTDANYARYPQAYSTMAVTKGKWYFEMKPISGDVYNIGVFSPEDYASNSTTNPYGGYAATGCIYTEGGEVRQNDGSTEDLGTYGTSDIVGCALDMDNNAVYFHKNNTYINSGNPASGGSKTGAFSLPTTGPYASNTSSITHYGFTCGDEGAADVGTMSINFGNPPYVPSSIESDANGYGSFEYAPPSGYYALCTKNLAEYG